MIEKNCTVSGQKFVITNEDLVFYKKMGVPAPLLCPDERLIRRMSWANQRTLYQRKCSATGKMIISNCSPDKMYPVYDVNYFWSDQWNQLDTARSYDFDRSFFDQYESLLSVAPRPGLQRSPSYDENSDYTNYAGKNKNCYLIFDSDKNRDAYYSFSVNSCESISDCYRSENCELCYECLDSQHCYGSIYLQNCQQCSHSYFLRNCIGCKNCFGCVNLRNKEYYFLNQRLSKSDYEQKIRSLSLDTYSGLKNMSAQFHDFAQNFPYRYMEGNHNENVKGNYLSNCKNAIDCFDSRKLWDCKYVVSAFDDLKDSMDCTQVGDQAELMYECTHVGYNTYNCKFFTHGLGKSAHLTYCFFTPYCENCFGCVGIHHKKFCILNKQYSEVEYYELLPKIIAHMTKTGEWGEFFPTALSPFAYNESDAQEYFPLTKSEALIKGYNWRDETKNTKYIGTKYKIPDNITDVPDSICNEILTCAVTEKNYRIQKQELKFYRQQNLPIPRLHPDERHRRRVALRNPRKLWSRKCDKCQKNIQTTFALDQSAKILCESCYVQIVN
jgi:hypothetical protein